jgi:hypothetical protein
MITKTAHNAAVVCSKLLTFQNRPLWISNQATEGRSRPAPICPGHGWLERPVSRRNMPRRVVAGPISQGRQRAWAAATSRESSLEFDIFGKKNLSDRWEQFSLRKPVCCHNMQSSAGSQCLRSCSTLKHLRALKVLISSVRPAHRMCFGSAAPTCRTQIGSLPACEATDRS